MGQFILTRSASEGTRYGPPGALRLALSISCFCADIRSTRHSALVIANPNRWRWPASLAAGEVAAEAEPAEGANVTDAKSDDCVDRRKCCAANALYDRCPDCPALASPGTDLNRALETPRKFHDERQSEYVHLALEFALVVRSSQIERNIFIKLAAKRGPSHNGDRAICPRSSARHFTSRSRSFARFTARSMYSGMVFATVAVKPTFERWLSECRPANVLPGQVRSELGIADSTVPSPSERGPG